MKEVGQFMLVMDRKWKKLLIKAVRGEPKALRQMGMRLYQGRGCRKAPDLARIFIKTAMERGDEKAYFLYNYLFFRDRKVIDDLSYIEMYQDYKKERDGEKRTALRKYLLLGTKRQKQNCHMTNKRY